MAMPATSFEPAWTDDERLTLLDLRTAVAAFAEDDAEVMATLRYMAETDHMKLEVGSFDTLPRAASRPASLALVLLWLAWSARMPRRPL